jgi:fengycin family lipopeptide synthetase E
MRHYYPHMELKHVYGPTENTTFSTLYDFPLEPEEITGMPIGKPINNSTLYILDDMQKLQPVGFIGEIYVGGDGLARGYLNNEQLTREKFISNPYKAGEWLYRTNDLGKWLPDGNVDFIGRTDDQVKIRGYRIEPGEIEAIIQTYPGISTVIVIARAVKDSEKQLIAYIVAESPVNQQELHSWLTGRVPPYMLPVHYIMIDEVPLTLNGKIDKRKLPAPEDNATGNGIKYTGPRNETEKILAAIWEQVLGLDRVGVTDKFLDLGGHSLLAVRMASLIKTEMNINLPIAALFQFDTVETLGNYIDVMKPAGEEGSVEYDLLNL